MSKYSNMDPEVLYLETAERVNFEFDMLNHDVDKYTTLSSGFEIFESLNPADMKRKLASKFKDWRTFDLGLITLCAFIFLIVLFVSLIFFIYYWGRNIEWKVALYKKLIMSCIFIFIVLGILFYVYGKLLAQFLTLMNLSKNKSKTKS